MWWLGSERSLHAATVKPSGSNDRWDVGCVGEVSEKAPTHLAGADANSGWLIAGDEKPMGSRGLENSMGWGSTD